MEEASRSLDKVRAQKLGNLQEPNTLSARKQGFQLLIANDDLLVLRVLENSRTE